MSEDFKAQIRGPVKMGLIGFMVIGFFLLFAVILLLVISGEAEGPVAALGTTIGSMSILMTIMLAGGGIAGYIIVGNLLKAEATATPTSPPVTIPPP